MVDSSLELKNLGRKFVHSFCAAQKRIFEGYDIFDLLGRIGGSMFFDIIT